MNKNHTSRQKSDRIYSGFLKWREKLLNLQDAVIVVEGKRDAEVLFEIGIKQNSSVDIIQYSQISQIEFNEIIQVRFKDRKIIPFVDFDRKGEEYLSELKKFKHCELELRHNLYSLTNGRLREFENLLFYLKKSLNPSYIQTLYQLLYS